MSSLGSYCDLEDVEGHTGYHYDGTTQPTNAKAMQIILDISAELDGALKAAGYTLPIPDTATMSLRLLKHYASMAAAYRCWTAMFKGGTPPPGVEAWREDFKEFLEKIEQDKMRLPDYEPTTGKYDAIFRVY